MSTPAAPVVVNTVGLSKASLILLILNSALTGLAAVPGIGAPAILAESFVQIIQAGFNAYQQETGTAIDLTKIPLETPAP
jgi:hypothetical protein